MDPFLSVEEVISHVRRRGGEEARGRGGEEARRRGGEEARAFLYNFILSMFTCVYAINCWH